MMSQENMETSLTTARKYHKHENQLPKNKSSYVSSKTEYFDRLFQAELVKFPKKTSVLNVNQACQRQLVSTKYTSSLCIFPRNNSFAKCSAIDYNQNKQMKKSSSLGDPVKEQATEQKEFSKLKSYELPRRETEISRGCKIYVSSVQASLSNSSKFQKTEMQSFGKGSYELNKNETFLGTQKEQDDICIEHFPETADTNVSNLSTDVFGNYFKDELRTAQRDNGNKTDKHNFFEDFETESEEADSEKAQDRTSFIKEEPRNRNIVRFEEGKKPFRCSQCGSVISQTASEQNCSQNENKKDEVDKIFTRHEMSSPKCSVKKISEEKVKIQKLPLMRSLTFSTPGKSASSGNFTKKKPPTLASISIQKRKLWKSMSISSSVPIIVVSSVDE